jgi:uncharacterized membrane protein YgdD (TMEM256/DUF423 family)
MIRAMLVLASVYGFLGVAFGAFGAHALKEKVPPDRLERLELAVRYAFFHVPALLAVAWLAAGLGGELFVTIAGWALGLGVLLFSGSLVALALTGRRRWGAVTPLGGVLLLVGWVALGAAAWTIGVSGDFPAGSYLRAP